MNPATVLDVVSVFFAGLLAGMEVVIHYGLRAPAEVLDERARLQLRQAMVLRLRVLVPAFFVPTAVSAIAAIVLDGAAPGIWFRFVGLLAVLIWIVIRVIGRSPGSSAHHRRIGKRSSTTRSGSMMSGSGRRSWRLRAS